MKRKKRYFNKDNRDIEIFCIFAQKYMLWLMKIDLK